MSLPATGAVPSPEPPGTADPIESAPARRRWPWVVAVVVVVVVALLVVAAVVVDQRLRAFAEDRVRTLVVQELALESASDVRVDLGPGSVLLQAIRGTVDRVEIEAAGADFGEFSGDLAMVATGVPIAEGEAIDRVDLEYRIPETEAERLAKYLSQAPLESVGYDDGEVVVGTTFSIFGFSLPVGMSLEAGVDAGRLTFTPTTLRAGDAAVSADQLRGGFFGALAEPFLTQQSVCLAGSLPADLALESASIDGDDLVLGIGGSAVVLGRGERGECV